MVAEPIQTKLSIDKSTWKKVTLGDVVKEVRETAKDLVAEGLERVVGLEHLDPESLHIKSWGSTADATTFTKKFRKGQMLFGRRRAYLKKAALATFDGICSGDITVLEAKNGLLPDLLPFLIQNDKFFELAVKNSAGSLSPRAKFNDFANYEFLLPPKDQQQQIAELLWAGDRALEALNVLREKNEVLRDRNRERLFTYGAECYVKKGRKLTIGKSGAIRSDWDEASFLDAIEITSGQVNPIEEKYSELFQIGPERMEPNTGKILEFKTVKELGISSGNYLFTEEHVLYSKIRPYFKKVANPGFKGLCSADVYPLKPRFKNLSKDFLFYYLLTEKFTVALLRFQNRTGMPKVNREEISSMHIPIPSLDEQFKIVKILQEIDKCLDQIVTHLNRNKVLQKSLINQFF